MLVYGKRGDYLIEDEFKVTQNWFDFKLLSKQMLDREFLKGHFKSSLFKLPFNDYNLYSGILNGLKTIPFKNSIKNNFGNDISNVNKVLNNAILRFFMKYDYSTFPYDLKNFKKDIDLRIWQDWGFYNSVKNLNHLNVYPTFFHGQYDRKTNLGFVPRFWSSRSFLTPSSLDQNRSFYIGFLQLFQLFFFIFNFIFMWGSFRYYITKADQIDKSKQVDKRIELLIRIYWILLFIFVLFILFLQYFTYDISWLKDAFLYHFYSFYITVCNHSAGGFLTPYEYKIPHNFVHISVHNPYISKTLFVFMSYMRIYEYILFFLSIIIIFEIVKRLYMKTPESYLIFFVLQFSILNYLFLTTSIVELFFVGKEKLMLFSALCILFTSFILWFHGSGYRICFTKDRYYPYIIKLDIPANNIIGNPNILIKALLFYLNIFKNSFIFYFFILLRGIRKYLINIIFKIFNKFKKYILNKKKVRSERNELIKRRLDKTYNKND